MDNLTIDRSPNAFLQTCIEEGLFDQQQAQQISRQVKDEDIPLMNATAYWMRMLSLQLPAVTMPCLCMIWANMRLNLSQKSFSI